MAEGGHYDLDPTDGPAPRSSHAYVVNSVPFESRCLEIGCATGYMSHWLTTLRRASVVGVETASEAAERARQRGITVICGSIEDGSVQSQLSMLGPFECVVLANVLEHVTEPERVLRAIKDLTSSSAVWVFAVPNVAHLSSRIRLILGRWHYDDYGIFDRGHLRFWNVSGFLSLLTSTGLRVDHIQWTVGYSPWPVRLLLRLLPLGSGRYPVLDRLLGNMFAYELVVVAITGEQP